MPLSKKGCGSAYCPWLSQSLLAVSCDLHPFLVFLPKKAFPHYLQRLLLTKRGCKFLYMGNLYQQHDLRNYPLRLSENEKNDVQSVMENFFADYTLADLRGMFEKIAETCLTASEHHFSNARERSDFYYFRKRTEIFFEAVYLWLQRKNTNAL